MGWTIVAATAAGICFFNSYLNIKDRFFREPTIYSVLNYSFEDFGYSYAIRAGDNWSPPDGEECVNVAKSVEDTSIFWCRPRPDHVS